MGPLDLHVCSGKIKLLKVWICLNPQFKNEKVSQQPAFSATILLTLNLQCMVQPEDRGIAELTVVQPHCDLLGNQ